MKIAILGYSGSGKSTLAAYLGKQYHTPCLHLDQIQFTANWQTRSDAAAKAMVTNFMKKSDWIIEGNYTRYFQAERLKQADQIILFYYFFLVMHPFGAYLSARYATIIKHDRIWPKILLNILVGIFFGGLFGKGVANL